MFRINFCSVLVLFIAARMNQENSAKKRKLFGRMTDSDKKLRLDSHELGQNCEC